MTAVEIEIQLFEADHFEWAAGVMKRNWGSSRIVSRGKVHDALELAGFVALDATFS